MAKEKMGNGFFFLKKTKKNGKFQLRSVTAPALVVSWVLHNKLTLFTLFFFLHYIKRRLRTATITLVTPTRGSCLMTTSATRIGPTFTVAWWEWVTPTSGSTWLNVLHRLRSNLSVEWRCDWCRHQDKRYPSQARSDGQLFGSIQQMKHQSKPSERPTTKSSLSFFAKSLETIDLNRQRWDTQNQSQNST